MESGEVAVVREHGVDAVPAAQRHDEPSGPTSVTMEVIPLGSGHPPTPAADLATALNATLVLYPDEGHTFRNTTTLQHALHTELTHYLRAFGTQTGSNLPA